MMFACASSLMIAFSCTFLRTCACIRQQFAAPDPESPRDMCKEHVHVQCGGPGQPCCDDGCSFGTTCTDKGCERCGGYNQLCCGHPKGDLDPDGLTLRELCPFAGMHLSWLDMHVPASCRTGDWRCCPSSGNYPELQLWSQNGSKVVSYKATSITWRKTTSICLTVN
jgi:hypothetical protein